MRREHYTGIVLTVGAAAVGTFLVMLLGPFVNFSTPASDVVAPAGKKDTRLAGPQFLPPRVEDAPTEIRDRVLEGQRLMEETAKYAGKYVGAKLTCSHCHFRAGRTDGGRNGGLSLVGVAARYPRYAPDHREVRDLAASINGCFERSLNGKKLPPDSRAMLSLLAYFQWISKGIPIYAEIGWLEPPELASDHTPDSTAGEQTYITRCSICHGAKGEGTEIAPPLWGPQSFNTGAAFHRLGRLAPFVYLNMPRDNPILSSGEALDASAYVVAQPRPQFHSK